MNLSAENFSFIANLVKKNSGIFLPEDKAYLVESRLTPVAKKFACADIPQLLKKVKDTADSKLISTIVDAMTTNESSFFRDSKPFDQLKNTMIKKLVSFFPKQTHFRIWSAACSTGQEPYSIAMTILENAEWGLHKYSFEIIATDISTRVLEKATNGVYSQFEVQRGVPVSMLLKYFKQEKEDWVISDRVKSMVKFSVINLVENISHLGVFDIIFCRNVLFYFDTETKVKVLHQISKAMKPNAMLLVGGAETVMNTNEFTLMPDTTSIYIVKK